jgi:flagellar protein FlgJ
MEALAATNSTTTALDAYNGYAGALNGLKTVEGAANSAESEKAWEAAKKVEATFLGMLLKEMEKTVEKGSLFHGGMGEDMFQNELDNAYIKSFENGQGVGIARLYHEEMMKRSQSEAAKARSVIKSEFIPLEKENPFLPLTRESEEFLPLETYERAPRFIALK